MQINVTYDSNTLATAPSAFFAAVNFVVNLFDTTFTNTATINIEVGYGKFPLDGSTVAPLGESEQNNDVFADYSLVKNTLVSEGAPGANTLPSSSPISSQLVLGSAAEKALSLIGADNTLDGWVGIASNATLQPLGVSWSFSPTATPASNQVYIVGTLEHEFAEVMGRTSYLTARGDYGIMDLYRYSASGVRQTGTGDPAYFSIDNGKTNLDNWNDTVRGGGDIGDWASNVSGATNFKFAGADAFLAFSPSGQIDGLTTTDRTLMAALGWSATPTASLNRFAFFTPNKLVNVAATLDGSNLPAPITGEFNLELVTAPVGTSYPLPSGYQGVAILPGGSGRILQVLSGDMTIVDSGSGDSIILGAGAQTVIGATGDTITGGSGNSLVNALAGGQSVAGGGGTMLVWAAGGDTISGSTGAGSSTIVAAKNSTITGGSGKDLVNALTGGALVTGGTGSTTIWGGAGDTISGGAGSGLIDGVFGNQQIGGGAGGASITGGAGAVLINGLAGSQQITGGSGDMTVWGGFGDTITGGSGKNALDGQPGDTILGGAGGGVIDGLLGNQVIRGGIGSYTILGGAGDTITGGSGPTTINGGSGADLINGLAGSELITGGTGAATIWGGFGDTITAGVGTAVIAGQPGNTIAGGSATNLFVNATLRSQSVTGSTGATTVWAGGGDTIAGGSGTMSVVIAHSSFSGAVRVGDNGVKGSDTVTGFSQTAGDRIFFPNETAASINSVVASAQTSNGNTVITLPDGGTMTLLGITKIDSTFFG